MTGGCVHVQEAFLGFLNDLNKYINEEKSTCGFESPGKGGVVPLWLGSMPS